MKNLARGMVAVATLLIAISVGAQEERSQTDPTATWWYFGQTGEQVNQLLSANNARLVSLKVQQVSPTYLFTVSMVANEGPYAKTWYWYYGVTTDQLVANIADLNLRIIDLEPYDVGGEIRFAAVLVANTGAESKGWWWYINATESDVGNDLAQNNARLVDIAPYLVNGELRYAVVMIENAGADQKGWWWYIHTQPGDIATDL